jgi:hypothetical protein
MNADLKRVRDSSLDGPSSSKRRALSSGASSPVNTTGGDDSGDADGLEEWMRVVESKRKEAIYRQMLEYRRSNARESARADALEQQCRAHERVLKSFEACWAQVSEVGWASCPLLRTCSLTRSSSTPSEIEQGAQTSPSQNCWTVSVPPTSFATLSNIYKSL